MCHVDVQVSQYNFLKILSLLHCIAFSSLLKVTWSYLYGCVSGLPGAGLVYPFGGPNTTWRYSMHAQLCLTLCNPMGCSLLGSSVHGILQPRILEWVAIPFSRVSSQHRDPTRASCIAGRFSTDSLVCSLNYLTIFSLISYCLNYRCLIISLEVE